MNTLSEDQYIRAEKLKKQELYRNMLDQQVRFNEVKRQNQIQNLRHPLNDGRYVGQPRYSVQYPPEENKYLPPLAYQPSTWNSNRNAYPRSNTEEDKTEQYLNNCEEIIRNLRELKGKKKQLENHSSQPDYHPRKQLEKDRLQNHQIQYYPKHNYFSSSGSAYNKNTAIDPTPKQYKAHNTKLSTLDESRPSNQKYTRRESSSKQPRNKKYLDKIVHPTAETEMKSNVSQGKQDSPESQSPMGIREEQKPHKKSSKVRHKLYKLSTTKKQNDRRVGTEPNEANIFEQDSEVKEQNKKDTAQLTACLVELTKYLKSLNQKQQKPKQDANQQSFGKRSRSKNQRQQLEDEKQDEDLKNSEKPPQEEQLSLLNRRVIEALKNASKKSHMFFLKMSDRSATKSPDLSAGREDQNDREDEETINRHKGEKPNHSRKSQTEQLARLLANHLDKHDENSDELNRCLKQLHQYLKNQNEEIKQLKTNRASQNASEAQKNSSPPKKDEHDNKNPSRSPSPQNNKNNPSRSQSPIQRQMSPATQRRKQLKLQQAILKNLKKARLRGSKFKQRVENFKKAHQPQSQGNQNNPQQKPKQQENQDPKQPQKVDDPSKNPQEVKPNTIQQKVESKVEGNKPPQQTGQPKKQGP